MVCGIQESGEVKDKKSDWKFKKTQSFFFKREEEVQQGAGSASGNFIMIKLTFLQSEEALSGMVFVGRAVA